MECLNQILIIIWNIFLFSFIHTVNILKMQLLIISFNNKYNKIIEISATSHKNRIVINLFIIIIHFNVTQDITIL